MKYKYDFLALLCGMVVLELTACTEDLDTPVQTFHTGKTLDFTVNIDNNSVGSQTRSVSAEPVHFDYPDTVDSLGVHLAVDVQPFVEDNKGTVAALNAVT